MEPIEGALARHQRILLFQKNIVNHSIFELWMPGYLGMFDDLFIQYLIWSSLFATFNRGAKCRPRDTFTQVSQPVLSYQQNDSISALFAHCGLYPGLRGGGAQAPVAVRS